MNQKLLLCLSLVFATGLVQSGDAQAENSTKNQESNTVGNISVKIENLPEGSSFDSQTVLSKLRTRIGDPFSQYIFDQDLKTLADEYDRVEPQIRYEDGKTFISLKVWVRSIIKEIKWEGNKYVKNRILQRELDITPGKLFNRVDFNKGLSKVKEYYIKKGYFESQLSYKLVQDPKTQEVDVFVTVDEGRQGKVDDIVFHGFTKKEESEILNKLYTRKYSSLTSWLTEIGIFREEALEQDRLTIFNYLQDKGYADARVKIQLLESPTSEGKIIIDISADKGTRYCFGNVSFDGNMMFTDEEIEKIFRAHPDTPYSPQNLRDTAEAIKDLYGRKGFVDTSVNYETQLVQDEPIYNVHFQINEGREYRIGMIRIIGNSQTESRVILRESLLIPGETFDSLKLKITQARLENMGYFKSVNVYAVRTQDDLSLGENYRDIYIEVDEQLTGNISLFSGFSSADNIFGGLDLTERNFNYKGIGSVFSNGLSSVRGGGEFLHMRASFGPKQQSYMVSWLTPYFLDTLWRLGFEFTANLNSTIISKDYDINTYNAGVFVNYPISPFWTYGMKYRIKNIDIDIDIDNPGEERKVAKANGLLSGIGASLNYDSTDSAIKPHNGLRSVIEGEFVGLGGHVSYLRTSYLNSYYNPIWRRGYMHYRWDFRYIVPMWKSPTFSSIPLSERFFLGGVASVRGYRDFSLGPRFSEIDDAGHAEKDNKDPTGGISSSLISMEYVQEIFSFLDAFAFIDAGYVTNQTMSLGTYRMSYGVGVTLDVMGKVPVTIGYGFPVNPRDKDQVRNFFFSMGGQF